MTSVRFLNDPTQNIELTTATTRVQLNCGLPAPAASTPLQAVVIPTWQPGHIEGLAHLPAGVPVYGAQAQPLPAKLVVGDFTITTVDHAVVIDDGEHLYGYAPAALTTTQATALPAKLDRKLKMLFLETTTADAIALCNTLAPEIVAASEALNAALDAKTRALVLAPEPGLYYTSDVD